MSATHPCHVAEVKSFMEKIRAAFSGRMWVFASVVRAGIVNTHIRIRRGVNTVVAKRTIVCGFLIQGSVRWKLQQTV